MRAAAPAWDEALNAGKESVACDLKAEPDARAARCCARADVVLEGFRPGVAERLGVGPDGAARVGRLLLDHRLRRGRAARAARRPRPQLPRLGGRARRHGARRCPPMQVADLAAGALARGERGPRRAARPRADGPRRATSSSR